MRIVLTGSSGRIGRAIFGALAADHEVVGIDRVPAATTSVVADFTAGDALERAVEGADAITHCAALHAPHVGQYPEREFERVNVEGTRRVAEIAHRSGVRRLVFTSTTALYGAGNDQSGCRWIDEETVPQPQTIYHRTKLAAERVLEEAASERMTVRILRISRCFPERADLMAAYRLHRGVDARDVADAHRRALTNAGARCETLIVSGRIPFDPADCAALGVDAPVVLRARCPELVATFAQRGWTLPTRIDRVYASKRAEERLEWTSRFGFDEVIAQLDRGSSDVIPVPA